MKKIYLLLILSLQGLFLTAQTVSINLDEQNIADVLTPEVQKTVTKITLNGHMTSADYAFVNDCSKLELLDMTDVITDSIPPYSLIKQKPLANLYLPKIKTLFYANAVKNTYLENWGRNGEDLWMDFDDDVTVHVTGDFPEIGIGERNNNRQVLFTIEKNNSRYVETEDGLIYSADGDTLVYYGPKDFYDWRELVEKGLDHFNVKVIAPFAFAYQQLEGGISLTFSDRLEVISQHAFEGITWLYTMGNTWVTADLDVYLGERPPRVDGIVSLNTTDYQRKNGSIRFIVPSMRTYLENSCLWAEAPIMEESYLWMIEYNSNDRRNYTYRDSNNNVLYYEPPHVIKTEWYSKTYNVENIEFTKTTEGTDSIISTDIEVEYGSYYMFIIAWKTIVDESGVSADWNPCHYVEYHDTIYSPIPDDDELDYDFEIYDDDGNLVFSSRRKGDKGSTEHLNGTLTNVPKSQQGDLKSRTRGRRFGESPWKSQRVNFGATGIRPLDASFANNSLYDLTGRPTDGTRKGIYIKEGKKIWVR
ncbi:MAG: hypothetical protein K6B45_00560 [Bacteroidaceae bacterium]|nr:hypothetical protein [Bacteroidaceae bacterium]